jgi:hypothetical protein
MQAALISPAKAVYFGIPGIIYFIAIPILGVTIFTYIMARRMLPLLNAAPDPRWSGISQRVAGVFKLWLGQYRHPRYMLAGVLHILLFSGFLILSIRSFTLVFIGVYDGFILPGFDGRLGHVYGVFKDLATSFVFWRPLF